MEIKLTTITCILIFILVIFLGYNYFYVPQVELLEKKKSQFWEEIEKNEIAYEIYSLKKKIDKYTEHFPKSNESSDFISKVTDKVRKSRVELLSIAPLKSEKLSRYYVMPVELKIRDSYHALGEFISLLESSTYYMRINHLSMMPLLKGEENVSRENNVINNIDLKINTFCIPK